MIDFNRKIARAEAEVKNAIEHGDRKGRWYAGGKRDALQNCRLEANISPFPAVFRERAIERMIRWREIASDYDGADRLRERDPAELDASADMIGKTAFRLHMGELE